MRTPAGSASIALLTAALLLLSSCSKDPTQSDEYATVATERDEALRRVDELTHDLDNAVAELDTVGQRLDGAVAALEEARQSLDAATQRSTAADADLAAADAELTEQSGRVDALTEALAAEREARTAVEEELRRILADSPIARADINAEVERVCAMLLSDPTGNAVGSVEIDYDDRWELVATEADMAASTGTCVGVEYLVDIALGVEFGGASPVVRRWTGDVRILAEGSPTTGDLATIDDVVADLNRLTEDVVVSRVDGGDAEITVHFAPQSEFPDILPQYVPGNDGFVWIFWGGDHALTNGTVLIRSDVTPNARSHLVREEVTQAFGLLNDSFQYDDSIFQQAYTLVGDYAAIDEVIIGMLYRSEVRPGMDEDDLRRIFEWRLET